MSGHDWSKPEIIEKLDKTIIGLELAETVAKRLKSGKGLFSSHRDYCGHGLDYINGKYRLLEVHDGEPEWSEIVAEWETINDFVNFLSRQSDWSLSGANKAEIIFYTDNLFSLNNQRLTKELLKQYAKYRT